MLVENIDWPGTQKIMDDRLNRFDNNRCTDEDVYISNMQSNFIGIFFRLSIGFSKS